MKKSLIVSLMMVAGNVMAQTPPAGWGNVPKTNVYMDNIATVHTHNRQNTRAEVWGWTQEQGYIKITVGCSFDSYWIEKDNKRIVESPYDPGHQFWFIKKAFCY